MNTPTDKKIVERNIERLRVWCLVIISILALMVICQLISEANHKYLTAKEQKNIQSELAPAKGLIENAH